MSKRTIEDMCVVCNEHGKPSCGYEERGLQRKCPYNAYIEAGYEQAEEDLALTWEDIRDIEQIINQVRNEYPNGIGAESFGEEVLRRFNESRRASNE